MAQKYDDKLLDHDADGIQDAATGLCSVASHALIMPSGLDNPARDFDTCSN